MCKDNITITEYEDLYNNETLDFHERGNYFRKQISEQDTQNMLIRKTTESPPLGVINFLSIFHLVYVFICSLRRLYALDWV